MFQDFPEDPAVIAGWDWQDYRRYVDDLLAIDLTPDNIDEWVEGWSRLASALRETFNRLYVARSVNTADEAAAQAYTEYLQNIYPPSMAAEQALKQKLLDSGLEPSHFNVPLRNFRAQADLFRDENLALLAETEQLATEYDTITGAQTVTWQGAEATLAMMRPIFQVNDRETREQAWRLTSERALQDRAALNGLWGRLYGLREQIARNAGRANYLEYRWQELLRFDYTPADALRFHDAIEQVATPAAKRMVERRRQRLGLPALRPWDLDVDPLGRNPLRPFRKVEELIPRTAAVFHRIDHQLGAYFDLMVQQNLLDLENRKNKAPGGYCIDFPLIRRPFIFANAVGIHDDVMTLLHEGGHAFHVFETIPLRRIHDLEVTSEFAEVASMSMEYLGAPFLGNEPGAFYSPEEAARAWIEHLESAISFWPYMAVVDAWQHWAYTHSQQATDPAACDAAWNELWDRFMPPLDWSGLEDIKVTGWQRKLHIFLQPFYYIEYGLAQLGAVQVWLNWQRDPERAVRDYRYALSLGGTRPLPQLFEAAGARLSFDAETLGMAVEAMERTITELEATKPA
jgi:oligoendopeptidase F